jgi:gentisate 1,2-dioxygenase
MTTPTEYSSQLASSRLVAGWAKPEPSIYPEPKRDFLPHRWAFTEARAALHQAGQFVSVEFAERRNLICVNPKTGNTYASAQNLVAAYQMVLPHESPRAHRHTPNALRVAIDVPPGTHTIVDGTRVDMANGDVLLTPSWMWHGHGNDSDREAYWIDILDVPLVQHLGPMFFEQHPERTQDIRVVDPNSPMRYRTLELAAAGQESAPGVRQSALGAPALRTIGLEAIQLAAGAAVPQTCTTASNLYVIIRGYCRFSLPAQVNDLSAGPGDVVAVPGWWTHSVLAETEAVVLRATDEPALRSLHLHRSAGDQPDPITGCPVVTAASPRHGNHPASEQIRP